MLKLKWTVSLINEFIFPVVHIGNIFFYQNIGNILTYAEVTL